jgi:tetratricopeptide (TPR) repeat protein
MNCAGALLFDRDQHQQAMDRYQLALTLARQVHSPLEEARALEGSGLSMNALGNSDAAIGLLRQSAAIYQEIGSVLRNQVVDTLAALEIGQQRPPTEP